MYHLTNLDDIKNKIESFTYQPASFLFGVQNLRNLRRGRRL